MMLERCHGDEFLDVRCDGVHDWGGCVALPIEGVGIDSLKLIRI